MKEFLQTSEKTMLHFPADVAALAANIILIILEITGLTMSFLQAGTGMFVYYTQNSNILALMVSIVYAASYVRALKNRHVLSQSPEMPPSASDHRKDEAAGNCISRSGGWQPDRIIGILKLMSTTCLMVTMIVVLVGVMTNNTGGFGFYGAMIEGPTLFMHTVCPLVCLISFLFLEPAYDLKFTECIIAAVPTFIYGMLSMTLNILKIWHGPYPFLYVYEQSVWMSIFWGVLIVGGALLIAVLLKLIAGMIRKIHAGSR